jgi:hypothetical protein
MSDYQGVHAEQDALLAAEAYRAAAVAGGADEQEADATLVATLAYALSPEPADH